MSTEIETVHRQRALELLEADAQKIRRLIEVQLANLTMAQCPLYEEVLDTQMFGLSRQIDFAVRLELIDAGEGKQLLESLEQQLSDLHDAETC
ncbi:YlaN family protein [Exiguobacterium sp.]|uniref:YlaN family protein n=1 Tax=Exiguobacterium sp. TaxID=44751 RepID=UPI0028AED85E|nr:YlaN family protein [Exiguobacterium sp.]